jgi:beta-glucosidase
MGSNPPLGVTPTVDRKAACSSSSPEAASGPVLKTLSPYAILAGKSRSGIEVVAMPNPHVNATSTTERSEGCAFPAGFLWGAATSAYQIEGAVTEDGRGESIWDRFSHTPGRVRNGDTGDVACDHYHRYRSDVRLMAELGLNAYRFSVAWPRIFPQGRGPINVRGLDFYDRLVDELASHGISPLATLYHWDLPQALEDAGGWPARETALAFADYAAVIGERLGDRVERFATICEPQVVAELGYRTGEHAPGRTEPDAALAAAHHLLLAHGLAVERLRATAPRAEIGIVLNLYPVHPATPHPLDVETAALIAERVNGWFLDPIAGRGYPPDAVRAAGWTGVEVQPGDLDAIARPIDFLGVNYYSRWRARSPALPQLPPAEEPERTGMGWEVYPAGLVEVLELAAERLPGVPLYVTENGAAYPDNPLDPTDDPARVAYLRRHLIAALEAIERGLPLRGYFVWSLLDNFEWAHGYSQRFGIVRVDFETQERQVRSSGRFWSAVARSGRVPEAPAPAPAAEGSPAVPAGELVGPGSKDDLLARGAGDR